MSRKEHENFPRISDYRISKCDNGWLVIREPNYGELPSERWVAKDADDLAELVRRLAQPEVLNKVA